MIRTIRLVEFRKALDEGRVEALRPIQEHEEIGEIHIENMEIITRNFAIFLQVTYFIYDDEVLKIEGLF